MKNASAVLVFLVLALQAGVGQAQDGKAGFDTSVSGIVADIGRLRQGRESRKDSEPGVFCRAMAGGVLPDADVLAGLDVGSAEVVILNESHFQSVNLAYPDLMRKIKSASPRMDCLYMEYVPGMEPKSREEARRDIPAFAAMFETAFDLGLKILYVDGLKPSPSGPETDHDRVVRRNPDMVERIARSLDEGVCRAGIMIVGKAHGYTSVEGKPTRPMKDLLTERGIPTSSINLVDRYVAKCPAGRARCVVALQQEKDFVRAPNAFDLDFSPCLADAAALAYGTGFINRRRGDFCSIPADSSGWGSVCDFDATLYY